MNNSLTSRSISVSEVFSHDTDPVTGTRSTYGQPVTRTDTTTWCVRKRTLHVDCRPWVPGTLPSSPGPLVRTDDWHGKEALLEPRILTYLKVWVCWGVRSGRFGFWTETHIPLPSPLTLSFSFTSFTLPFSPNVFSEVPGPLFV